MIGLSNPAFAKDIPILKEIFKYFENNSDVSQDDLSKNAKSLNITKEISGTKVTIEEAVCDGNSVYLTYRLENKEPFPYFEAEGISNLDNIEIVDGQYVNPEFEIYPIENLNVWLEGYSLNYLDNNENECLKYSRVGTESVKIIDNKTAVGMIQFLLKENSNGEIPESFKLSFEISRMWLPPQVHDDIENCYSIDEKFNFDVPITVDKTIIEEIEVSEVKDGFKLEKIIKTPYSIQAKVVPLNPEHHQNSSHPKIIKFDTKIYPKK